MNESEIVQKIMWWTKDMFSMPKPVCDFCNDPIDIYPCPIKGSHALCSHCSNKIGIKQGHKEYFETASCNLGMEKKRIGINCGGR